MMTKNVNLTSIDSSIVDVYLKPSNDWHIYDEGFEVSPNLNFTWQVVEFNGR